MKKTCVVCGKEFEAKTERAKYCSKYCANRSRYVRSSAELKRKREELNKKIIDLYESDLTTKEIAFLLGKYPAQINKAWRDAGLPKRLTPFQKEVKKLKGRGYSSLDIAKELGVKTTLVKYAANAIGDPFVYEEETRTCKRCGKPFKCHPHSNQIFCSIECQKAYLHATHDILRRQRVKEHEVDRDITLERVADRDHNICQICGKPVDWNDYKVVNGKKVSLGNYPSRDHIVPLCKGGSHSWDNIRLAHVSCNSRKGARANG